MLPAEDSRRGSGPGESGSKAMALWAREVTDDRSRSSSTHPVTDRPRGPTRSASPTQGGAPGASQVHMAVGGRAPGAPPKGAAPQEEEGPRHLGPGMARCPPSGKCRTIVGGASPATPASPAGLVERLRSPIRTPVSHPPDESPWGSMGVVVHRRPPPDRNRNPPPGAAMPSGWQSQASR